MKDRVPECQQEWQEIQKNTHQKQIREVKARPCLSLLRQVPQSSLLLVCQQGRNKGGAADRGALLQLQYMLTAKIPKKGLCKNELESWKI